MGSVPAQHPALRLAIAFVNTYDLLESPPDRLTIPRVARITRQLGYADLAERIDGLGDNELDRMRGTRDRLYAVYAAGSATGKVDALNAALDHEPVRPHVVIDPTGSVRMSAAWTSQTSDPVGELAVLIIDAMAHAMAVGGPDRFGTCVADPCRCAYVDRTRAGRQRFCCQLCNDRMAAAAYRSRRAAAAG